MKNSFAILSILIISISSTYAQNLEVRDQIDFFSNTSDVWGWSDGVSEYALVGLRNGTSIVDVTDPDDIDLLQHVYGNNCTWRDIKTFESYAYVVNDCNSINAGMDIFDLSVLPDSVNRTPWRTDGTTPNLRAAHNLFIDENGFLYICGHNYDNGGVTILDLNTNPIEPTVVGHYTDSYVHDLFVRNDTMWTAEISAGRFSVIDISDKANPVVLARQSTPVQDCHNIWVSDDGNIAFTTDETTNPNVSLSSYDVSDLSDIKLLDEYKTSPNSTPHNAHVLNDFVVVSHYAEGVKILDASLPDELVEVGSYDTAPNESGLGYDGCWGVYPYLPSGIILAADQQKGLYVFDPSYKKAVHIRGVVIDAITGNSLFNATVDLSDPDFLDSIMTDLDGAFQKGYAASGSYTVNVSLDGYVPFLGTYPLDHGDVLELEIELIPILTPTDTIYSDVFAEASVVICNEEISSGDIETTLLCDYDSESNFGEWTINEDGCLEYSAYDTTGNYIDSLCFIVVNAEGDETSVSIVIVTILENVTATEQNVFENGDISLLQNPVRNLLYLKNELNKEGSLTIQIFDVSGSMIIDQHDMGFNNLISVEVSHLHKGMYILTIQSESQNLGHVKFIKN